MADNPPDSAETLEQMQARHRREAKDLQGRITSKKKNATKKTRKGVNDECAEMERQMRERQAEEARGLLGGGGDEVEEEENTQPPTTTTTTTDEDVAAKLNTLELGAKPPQQPAPAPSPPQTTGEEEGGGNNNNNNKKKRNRQKERLARRAAEQEAAAEAAEHEAAGMTDHRGAERARMQAEFARRGLEEREIRPDGHCLFSAVADQLGAIGVPLAAAPAAGGEGKGEEEESKEPQQQGEEGYKIVRRRAAGYIEAHGDEYAGFLEEGLESYVRKMRDTAEWGGQLELLALASVYDVEIGVVQDREAEVVRPSGGGGGEDDGAQERKKIWLAYYRHGYGLGEHYNSLRKKEGA